jgi:outer membrane biosynthesis protein TonB
MRRTRLAVLLSSMSIAAVAASAMQLNDAAAPTSRAISTGVTSPKLVYSTSINIPADKLSTTPGTSAKVVLHVDLDATGTPTSIRVLQPATPEIDARVIDGVRPFRWTPAVLNNKPVATDLTLTVEVKR